MWDIRNYKADYQRAAGAEHALRSKFNRMTEQRQSLAEEAEGLRERLDAAKATAVAAETEFLAGRRGEASLEEARQAEVLAARHLSNTMERITSIDTALDQLHEEVNVAAEETATNACRYWSGVAIGLEDDFRRLAVPLIEQLAVLRFFVRGAGEVVTLADIAQDLCGSRWMDDYLIGKKAAELADGHGVPVPVRNPTE